MKIIIEKNTIQDKANKCIKQLMTNCIANYRSSKTNVDNVEMKTQE